VSNEPGLAASLLQPGVRRAIGMLETNFLAEADLFVYSVEDVSFGAEDDDAALEYLNSCMAFLRHFLFTLWTVKDNGGNFEQAFVEAPKGGSAPRVTSNTISGVVSNARVLPSVTVFTRDELRTARQRYNALFGTRQAEWTHVLGSVPSSYPRFMRGVYFIQGARIAPELLARIAFCCTALEALFATDSAELTHKLAERAACFVRSSLGGRREVYQRVKAAYSHRSRFVHGAGMSGNRGELEEMSVFLDELLRDIVNKIGSSEELITLFLDPRTGGKTFDQFMLDMVLA
jgi:hypothetical protein